VPERGLGINPRRPRIRPSRPTRPIISGVAMETSKSRNSFFNPSHSSSPPTMSAPASSAIRTARPGQTPARERLCQAVGQYREPPDLLVGMSRVNAMRICNSTVSSKLACALLWPGLSHRSADSCGFGRRVSPLLRIFLPCSAFRRLQTEASAVPSMIRVAASISVYSGP